MQRLMVWTMAALLPAGCTITNETVAPTAEMLVKSIEEEQSEAWIGRHVSELSAAFGRPDGVINATLLGGPPSEAWLYAADRVADTGDCVNAYVVHMVTGEVLFYFCR